MTFARIALTSTLLLAMAATAQAETGKTRAQVKAELAEGIRTGDVLAAGDSGLKLNEQLPRYYAKLRIARAGAAEPVISAAAAEVATSSSAVTR